MIDFKDVVAFHEKFGIRPRPKPTLLSDEVFVFRDKFLREEVREFADSHHMKDLEGALDSLVDLVYVAYGTAIMMGISPQCWQEAWKAVHEANMKKIRAPSKDHSKRGSALDCVKPDGWAPPDLAEVIRRHS